jgi:hypothetical protein
MHPPSAVAGQMRFDLALEIGAALTRLARTSSDLSVKIVAVDFCGRPVEDKDLDLEGVDLLID